MNRLSIKMFFEEGTPIDSGAFLLLFHRMIQKELLPNEQPIDVVSYRHVPHGPWVVMICTEGQYVLDGQGGRPGLKYISRGSSLELGAAMIKLARAAIIVERELKVRFRTDEVELELLDRRRFPNTREGFAIATGVLATPIGELFEQGELSWSGAADLLGPMKIGLHTERRSTLAVLCTRAALAGQTICNVA